MMQLELNDVMEIISHNYQMFMKSVSIARNLEPKRLDEFDKIADLIKTYTATISRDIEKAETERVENMLKDMEAEVKD